MAKTRARSVILLAAFLASAAIYFLVQRSRPDGTRTVQVPPISTGSPSVIDSDAGSGISLRTDPPPAPPMAELPPTLRVSPAEPNPPDPATPIGGAPESAAETPLDPQAPLQVVTGAGGAGGDVDPFLRARVFVHPEIPAAVSKKRIRGTVRMQPRVGVDGRVLEVRVLSSIRNCPECTQAAVDAARRLVYDAPTAGPVWAAAISMEFNHNRR